MGKDINFTPKPNISLLNWSLALDGRHEVQFLLGVPKSKIEYGLVPQLAEGTRLDRVNV